MMGSPATCMAAAVVCFVASLYFWNNAFPELDVSALKPAATGPWTKGQQVQLNACAASEKRRSMVRLSHQAAKALSSGSISEFAENGLVR